MKIFKHAINKQILAKIGSVGFSIGQFWPVVSKVITLLDFLDGASLVPMPVPRSAYQSEVAAEDFGKIYTV